MIKGCNKRVIVMKDTGNDVFEEAFFILKPEASKARLSEGDIIKQANRILEQSIYNDNLSRFSVNGRKTNGKGRLYSFVAGAVIGAFFMAGIFLVL